MKLYIRMIGGCILALVFAVSTAFGREETAVFAGGCFWGVEAVFEHVKGVTDATSGYAGGTKATANYEAIGSGTTGHAESVRVTFDPDIVSYQQLLQVFFSVAHNPTELNRQGGRRPAVSIRDLLCERRTKTNSFGRDRRIDAEQSVQPPYRDAGRPAKGILPCRGLPSGLHAAKPRRHLYRRSRSPKISRIESQIPGALHRDQVTGRGRSLSFFGPDLDQMYECLG